MQKARSMFGHKLSALPWGKMAVLKFNISISRKRNDSRHNNKSLCTQTIEVEAINTYNSNNYLIQAKTSKQCNKFCHKGSQNSNVEALQLFPPPPTPQLVLESSQDLSCTHQ
jgi:hypothetical protein